MAMRWARSTFLTVIGKNAPAFTVASLAMIITRRPATSPMPVTTPADGAPPHSGVHVPGGPQAELEERAGVDQAVDPLAGGEPALLVLPLDRPSARRRAGSGLPGWRGRPRGVLKGIPVGAQASGVAQRLVRPDGCPQPARSAACGGSTPSSPAGAA